MVFLEIDSYCKAYDLTAGQRIVVVTGPGRVYIQSMPVIVYGVSAGVVYGPVYWITALF